MSGRNPNTRDIDSLSALEILRKINGEDKKVAVAVEEQLDNISGAVDIIVSCFQKGGRLFYIGSGTSGKLGVIDASECPPTFGVDDEMVQGIISGGKDAISGWLEHTEDDEELAVKDIQEKNITDKDVLVGITASGNTPYVKRAMEYGKKLGCKTIGVICRTHGKLSEICDLTIAVDVGPEVIMGSTRMKAGTAQKMILNMLSTTAMIRMGKTYSNLMVSVKPINKKLKERVKEIVNLATGADINTVESVLEKCNFNAKVAIVVIKSGISIEEAIKSLEAANGKVTEALSSINIT
ncbi:MAG: N-acetylmuramic acid 6-phosphate etherase [Clostridiaceae bacterium]|nr:N-acetylmuramic acid 6-phosphate etherase [Clostridiaceae bacterium]